MLYPKKKRFFFQQYDLFVKMSSFQQSIKCNRKTAKEIRSKRKENSYEIVIKIHAAGYCHYYSMWDELTPVHTVTLLLYKCGETLVPH